MKNEIEKIFGAYIGCPISLSQIHFSEEQDDTVFTLGGVKGGEFMAKETELWYPLKYRGTFKVYPDQLLLTPLIKITDEHALEVCHIGYGSHDIIRHHCSADIGRTFVQDFSKIKSEYIVNVIDYLRSVGYDCGYGSIKSLIELGIAKEK